MLTSIFVTILEYTYIYTSIFLSSTKPFPDKSFCLNDCRFGGNDGLVKLISCLVLGLCLFACNLDFIDVLSIYYVETT